MFSLFSTLQLYVQGELVGGLDIIKEMQHEGALAPQLGVTPKVSTHTQTHTCQAQAGVRFFHLSSDGFGLSTAVGVVLLFEAVTIKCSPLSSPGR